MDVIGHRTQSKAWLSSNLDVSNRKIKKTKPSLFRGTCGQLSKLPGLCDLTTLRCQENPIFLAHAKVIPFEVWL